MLFEEYNGWPNRPTWGVFTILTSYEGTRLHFQALTDDPQTTPETIQQEVTRLLHQWAGGKGLRQLQEGIAGLASDAIGSAISNAEWWSMLDALETGTPLKTDNAFTIQIYKAIAPIDWRPIIASPPQPDEHAPIEEQAEWAITDEPGRLREWIRASLETWHAARSDGDRKRMNMQEIGVAIIDTWLSVIVWKKVYSALKGE